MTNKYQRTLKLAGLALSAYGLLRAGQDALNHFTNSKPNEYTLVLCYDGRKCSPSVEILDNENNEILLLNDSQHFESVRSPKLEERLGDVRVIRFEE